MTTSHGVRPFSIPEVTRSLKAMRRELDEMRDVLMGREDPPVDMGVITLMEVASAYHARALEMQMLIHRAEAHGNVSRGDPVYRFRTGELRDFLDLAKGATELGSRRVTNARTEFEMSMRGLE